MLWERKSKSSKMEFFHTSVWQTFGKPRYFFSLVEMCNLVGVEPTVQTHCGMWVWRRTTTGSLCQPGERRGGGDLSSTTMWCWKRGVIIKYPACPFNGWEKCDRKGGGKWEWGRAEGIILQGSTLWHNDPYVSRLSLSSVFAGCLWVMGGRGQFRWVIRVITHAW